MYKRQEFIARSAAAFVGVSIDGRPLRGLFERSSSWVSSICAMQFFHSIVGYSRPTPYRSARGPTVPLGSASFCQEEWLALFRPWHNGGPPITRRPPCDKGGCLRSPSWLCHDGGAVNGLEFKKSRKQSRKNYRKKSKNIGQNRGLLTHTFSTIRTRIFFLFFS